MKRKNIAPLNLKFDLTDTKQRKSSEGNSPKYDSFVATPPTLAVKTVSSYLTKNTSLMKLKKAKKDIDPMLKQFSQGNQLVSLHAPPLESYHER